MAVKTTAGLACESRAVTRSVMDSASLGPLGSLDEEFREVEQGGGGLFFCILRFKFVFLGV